jgi:hypothetical protein
VQLDPLFAISQDLKRSIPLRGAFVKRHRSGWVPGAQGEAGQVQT